MDYGNKAGAAEPGHGVSKSAYAGKDYSAGIFYFLGFVRDNTVHPDVFQG